MSIYLWCRGTATQWAQIYRPTIYRLRPSGADTEQTAPSVPVLTSSEAVIFMIPRSLSTPCSKQCPFSVTGVYFYPTTPQTVGPFSGLHFLRPSLTTNDGDRNNGDNNQLTIFPVHVARNELCRLVSCESPRAKRRMLTKSYSLPLWKRKPTQFSDSEADESPSTFNNVEETRVVLKVPLPTGARRRRAASLDTGSSSSAFGSVKLSSSLPDASPIASGLQTSTFAITVDEVDRRHRSQNHTGRSASFSESSSPVSPSGPRYPHDRSHERDTSYESVSSSNSEDLTPETIDSRRRLRSSPIEEEDETQLFPLPSPRRSPSGSGASSPAASPKPTPVPSPNASTSCLDKPASSSKESINSATGSSEDGVLKHSLSRKTPDGLLSPSLSSTITVDAPRPPRPTLPRTHERKVSLPTPVSPKGPRPPLSLSLPMPTKQPNTPSSARDTPLTPPPSSLAHTPKRPEEPEQTRHERRGSDAGRTAERRQWDVWGSLLTLSSGVVRI
ncbi:uncharacterized protein LACBIDRAFT_295726 [Laccaria bicolor S238N-H82]|uniref:Predicted protein n=1 Tax=Laccaria bicolor (strain S238N-H82 / ATCC MYA-4686) TaxID=486041 RepID=B0DXL6_LACBS|nr:uncharacterized protein LACBIDRAFT_295726 [Laccaria bicolor S238N-H82]EDR00699.1 predicted protein [Laccaria bicolor S238N-H82]|eukprot:XP_001888708.1 predicted protein [Laccaria bicolor S238N-H82]